MINPFLIHKISETLLNFKIPKSLINTDKQGIAEAQAINIVNMVRTLDDIIPEAKRQITLELKQEFDAHDYENILSIINKYL